MTPGLKNEGRPPGFGPHLDREPITTERVAAALADAGQGRFGPMSDLLEHQRAGYEWSEPRAPWLDLAQPFLLRRLSMPEPHDPISDVQALFDATVRPRGITASDMVLEVLRARGMRLLIESSPLAAERLPALPPRRTLRRAFAMETP